MTNRWQKCWDANPEIYTLLKESTTLEEARAKLIGYLHALDWNYRRDFAHIESWDYILLKEAVRAFKNIISPRNESLAQVSSLKYLWKSTLDNESLEIEEGFIEEFYHLFKAIRGHSEIYPPAFLAEIDQYPDFSKLQGRESGIARSDYLDRLSKSITSWLDRYPSGFNPKIVERRIENKKRILDVLGGNKDDWYDYRWQFRNVMSDGEGFMQIKEIIELTPDEEKGIQLALENDVPFGVTPHYLQLMDRQPSKLDYVIRRQVFPPLSYVRRVIMHQDNKIALDFMREHDTSPIELITRRYAKVCILKPYDSCPQICVYCQRNWEITSPFMPGAMAPEETLNQALAWLSDHEAIMDVLVTGGDPLVMNDRRIEHIVKSLAEIPHIRSIRIATRFPVTVPMRITLDLCKIFEDYYEIGEQTLCMVTHIEHPYEITRDMGKAIQKVKKAGMHVYNQQVFTFANSKRFETVALRIAMKQVGIDPYYLFNLKGKQELTDYAAPVARVLQERKEEARLLPGIFRSDEPVFNVPFLGKNHLARWQDHELISILPDGRRMYSFHAWEKNLAKVRPYLYTDVSIHGYLGQLKEMGENPQEYQSIWYYY
jgi:lysine 2,3-aminomutase